MDKEMDNIKAAFFGILLFLGIVFAGCIEGASPKLNVVGAEPIPASQVNGVEYDPIVEEMQNGPQNEPEQATKGE